jgi:hypothetical protein
MASFSCSGSQSPKPPYRVTCLHHADGQHSRGGSFFAIKPVRSASIPRSGREDTLACLVSPVGLRLYDPRQRRLRRYVLGLGAALADKRPPWKLDELVCGPPSASEPVCIECVGWPQYLLVSRKRAAVGFRPSFRCEVHRTNLGHHQARDRARLRKLLFAWIGLEKPQASD